MIFQKKSVNAADVHFQGETDLKPSLIDTDILSLFFKNHPNVTARFASYLNNYKNINISIITYYEILSGLKHRDADKSAYLQLPAPHPEPAAEPV